MENQESYFDGSLLQLIGYNILTFLLSLCTLGIGVPWAVCMMERWECKHTVVEGRRLYFDGTGLGLFGSYLKWFLLSIVTLGIYALWIPIKMRKWTTSHKMFA